MRSAAAEIVDGTRTRRAADLVAVVESAGVPLTEGGRWALAWWVVDGLDPFDDHDPGCTMDRPLVVSSEHVLRMTALARLRIRMRCCPGEAGETMNRAITGDPGEGSLDWSWRVTDVLCERLGWEDCTLASLSGGGGSGGSGAHSTAVSGVP